MKKFLLLIVAIATLQAYAQDVIVKTDGSTILSKVLEVNTNDIKYKKHSNPNGPTYTINKSEVLSINYQNGDKDMFNDKEEKHESEKETNGESPSEKSQSQNNAIIQQCNSVTPIWLEQQKMKDAKYTYNIMKFDENSIIENDDIKQTITIGRSELEKKKWGELDTKHENDSYYCLNHVFCIKITNKTNRTLYIDLGNTFIVRGDEAQPYYIPSATETSQVSSSGVGVNLGAVTGALGIGGSVGTLANGINVNNGQAIGSKTIEYSQRVIAIPPLSSKSLDPQLLFLSGGQGIPYTETNDKSDKDILGIKVKSFYQNLQVGDIIHWNKEDPTIKIAFYLTYSFDETLNNLIRTNIGLYTSETYGISTKWNGIYVVDQLKDWQNAPFRYFLRNDPSKGLNVQQLNIEHTGKQ